MGRIQREWSALLRTIDGLAPAQMSTPMSGGWSIKDNLAHISAWEQFLVHHYLQGQPRYLAMQIDADAFTDLDETGINAVIQERNRDRPVADVLTDLHQSHDLVLKALAALSFADLMQPRLHDGPVLRPLISWVIGNTYEHYSEHRQNIERKV
jgi:hypothetical protein